MKRKEQARRKTRPVMRYPGGKFKIAQWTVKHFCPHGLYVDVFGGAGSILMAKPPSQGEVYNDIDEEIVDVFRVLRVKSKAEKLERLLRLTPFSYVEYRKAYQKSKDPVENARRVIFRSFASIGSNGVTRAYSGFRGLKNNETAVTSAQEWSGYPDFIGAFTERLKNVVIECRDYRTLLEIYDRPDTLFYFDPPYLIDTRNKSNRLYRYEFKKQNKKTEKKTDEQWHRELAAEIMKLEGNVIIAGYASPLYAQLYEGWQRIDRSTTAQNGKARVESIWISPKIQPMLF